MIETYKGFIPPLGKTMADMQAAEKEFMAANPIAAETMRKAMNIENSLQPHLRGMLGLPPVPVSSLTSMAPISESRSKTRQEVARKAARDARKITRKHRKH